MSISLVAGLGNPGADYANTRHNLGFKLVEVFGELNDATWQQDVKMKVLFSKIVFEEDKNLHLIKPQDFMNNSGKVLAKFSRYYKIDPADMVVAYDDINIELGRIKISVGGSAGGHNGIEDIMAHCGNEFIRFRIGIGHKKHREMDLKDHVLGKIDLNEKSVLTSSFPEFINDLKFLIKNGPTMAMNSINTRK